jgi:glycosyltransferase involved in cell wall biosynthesis
MKNSELVRVTVIHPWLPQYRVAFFELLIEKGRESGLEIRVYAPSPERRLSLRRDSVLPSWLHPVRKWELTFRGRGLIYKRLVIDVFRSKPDVVVLEHAVKNMETYLFFLLRKFFHYKIVIWGHGKTYSSRDSRLGNRIKIIIAQRADHFFSYTEGGADYLRASNIPNDVITVLNNAFDTTALRRNIEKISETEVTEFATKNQLVEGKIGLFIGGLDQNKDIRLVLSTAKQLNEIDSEFKLVVIGDGTELKEVLNAQALGFLVYLGRLQDTAKTLSLMAASFLMIPRGIGLVSIDALLSGAPILSIRENFHGPEHEYLVEGKSAHYVDDESEYLDQCIRHLGRGSTLIERKNLNLQELEKLSTDNMVHKFIDGLNKAFN